MKYNYDTRSNISRLHSSGLSSRQIADALMVSKSGVNDFLNKVPKKPSRNGPKVLLFDLETSASVVYAFGRHKVFVNQDAIHEEGGKILMASYRWLHEDKTHMIVNKQEIRAKTDLEACLKLYDLFCQADAVVAHNARRFDVKMLETRCLFNGLLPLPSVQIIDTLEIAKSKFRFPSNKLDSLAAYLGIGRKVSHSGMKLWVDVQEGDEEALVEMLEYCEHDTELLLQVFLELRSRGLVSGFNAANYYDDNKTRCKTCGSDNLEATGRIVTTPTGRFNEIRCVDCGSLHRDKVNQNSKQKRDKLLMHPKQ